MTKKSSLHILFVLHVTILCIKRGVFSSYEYLSRKMVRSSANVSENTGSAQQSYYLT